jgi:hypothetical protein
MYVNTDVAYFQAYTSGAVLKSSTYTAAGSADTDYDISGYKTADGRVVVCYEGGCDATPGTGALQDGMDATMYLSVTSTSAGSDGWLRNLVFLRRLR